MRFKLSLEIMRRLAIFLILFLISSGISEAVAQPKNTKEFLRTFQSPRVLFPSDNSDFARVNPGRYPAWMLWFFQKPFAWSPQGDWAEYEEACSPDDLSSKLLNEIKSEGQASIIIQHKSRCQKSFQTGSRSEIVNGIRMMSMELDIHHHSLMHRVIFKLPGGVQLKGLLALKGDLKKRPLVILRLGIFSNVEEFLPERYLMMFLYEQGLANFLVLENMTSADFIANNRRYSVGGYEEGIQNMQVAKILRNPGEPLNRVISSLHFMGISLGGHGVIFASLLNDYNKYRGEKLAQSFTAICPVVKLRDTVRSLYEDKPGIIGAGIDYWASLRLEGLREKVPGLGNHSWLDLFKFKAVFLPRTFQYIEQQFLTRPPKLGSVNLPSSMEEAKDFWQANDFFQHYRKVESPLLVMATQEDNFVNPRINFDWFKEISSQWESNIGTVLFEEGYHCTLPIAYDWATLVSLFNARVMTYDKKTRIKMREVKFEVTSHFKNFDPEQHSSVKFVPVWPVAGSQMVLKFSTSDRVQFDLEIPPDELDFKFNPELNSADRLTLVRWANHNIKARLISENGRIFAVLSWPQVL